MNVAAATQKIGLDVPVLVAFSCIIVILLAGSLYSPEFLSLDYLLQQLQVGQRSLQEPPLTRPALAFLFEQAGGCGAGLAVCGYDSQVRGRVW